MQTDPIGTRDDFNLYAYVGNDSLNGRDQSGTSATCTATSCQIACETVAECLGDYAYVAGVYVSRLIDRAVNSSEGESDDEGSDEEPEAESDDANNELPKGDEVKFDDKIKGQLGDRGWTEEGVREATTTEPSGTSVDNTGGQSEPATVYGSKDGGHVIVNDKTGKVVQVSDKNDPDWKPDRGIRWKEDEK